MTDPEQTLESLINECLVLRQLVSVNIPFSPSTPTPRQFKTMEAATEFRMEVREQTLELDIARKQQRIEIENLKTIEKKIVSKIPVRNSWIRIMVNEQETGIGYRSDDWGGGHTVLEIRLWREDLPPIPDRIH